MMSKLSHILLVEDNPDDYEATVRSFKSNHFANPVQWCKNGQDALNYLHKKESYANDEATQTPGIIFLDLNMPGLDGRKTLKIIKENETTKRIPVVILTTSSDPKDVDQCYAMGASTYIQKPVSFEGLVDAVRTMKDYWFNIALLPSGEE
jgi:two-component system, response regulator